MKSDIVNSTIIGRYLHLAEPAELTEPTELVCYVPMDIVRVTLPSLTLIDNLGIPLCFVKLSLIGYSFFSKLCIIVSPSSDLGTHASLST